MRSAFLSAVVLILFAGCRDSDVRVYRVAKEGGAASRSDLSQAGEGDAPPAAAARGAGPLRWVVPEGWRPGPAGAMRLASFKAGPSLGADVSVTAFPGRAGGAAANVNRWRSQVGLEAIGEEALSSSSVRVRTEAGEASVVDLIGADGRRIVGAMLELDGSSWFVKMSGRSDEVGAAKESFLAFVRSLRR